MAKPIGDEELQLKRRARRRLIGAIVLVTAVVVVLPMVLDSEPKPVSQEIDIRIPSPDSAGSFTSKVVPVPAPDSRPAPKPPAVAKTEPAATVESKAPKVPPPAAPDATIHEGASAKEAVAQPKTGNKAQSAGPPAKKAAAVPATKSGKYVVQIAALSDAGKAKQMQEKISAAGIQSYTQVVKTAKGDVTRVRAGPYATREAAEKAQKQLKSAGFDGKVVPRQ
jgi:DedD protein